MSIFILKKIMSYNVAYNIGGINEHQLLWYLLQHPDPVFIFADHTEHFVLSQESNTHRIICGLALKILSKAFIKNVI